MNLSPKKTEINSKKESSANMVTHCNLCYFETLFFYVYCAKCKKVEKKNVILCVNCYEKHKTTCKAPENIEFFVKSNQEKILKLIGKTSPLELLKNELNTPENENLVDNVQIKKKSSKPIKVVQKDEPDKDKESSPEISTPVKKRRNRHGHKSENEESSKGNKSVKKDEKNKLDDKNQKDKALLRKQASKNSAPKDQNEKDKKKSCSLSPKQSNSLEDLRSGENSQGIIEEEDNDDFKIKKKIKTESVTGQPNALSNIMVNEKSEIQTPPKIVEENNLSQSPLSRTSSSKQSGSHNGHHSRALSALVSHKEDTEDLITREKTEPMSVESKTNV